METPDSTNNAIVLAKDAAPLVRSILQKVGFHIVGAGQASEPTKVELAVVDADGADSGAVMQELHGRYPAARVLLLSEKGVEKLHEVPGFGHIRGVLRKPFKRSQLVGTVLNLMEQPRVMSA